MTIPITPIRYLFHFKTVPNLPVVVFEMDIAPSIRNKFVVGLQETNFTRTEKL